jgi:uncharacterized DUF497 family protein
MRFEWDERKNAANFGKHGVSFEEAQTVWVDRDAVEYHDSLHSERENRFIRVGYSTRERLLLVVSCERAAGSTVRLISARSATKRERRQHEEGV